MLNYYKKVIDVLDKHLIVGLPTETVYGLGIYYDDEIAYKKLVELKKRDFKKPIAIMVREKYELEKHFIISENAKKIIDNFLPGPLTILLPIKGEYPYQCHLGTNVVGIRIPKDKKLQRLLTRIKKPLQVTSFNLSNDKPSTSYKDALKVFGSNDGVEIILKGNCKSKIPTTVIDLTSDNIKIIREGEISKEDILEVLK